MKRLVPFLLAILAVSALATHVGGLPRGAASVSVGQWKNNPGFYGLTNSQPVAPGC